MRVLRILRSWVGVDSRLSKKGAEEAGAHSSAPLVAKPTATPDLPPGRFPRAPRYGRHQGMLPWYRNASEFAEAVAACEAALTVPATPVSSRSKQINGRIPQTNGSRLPAMEPDEAARLFASHMMSRHIAAPLGDAELDRLYSEHCAELGVVELHKSTLREALKFVPGVYRRQRDVRSSDGRRQRPKVWEFVQDEVAIAA